MIAHQYSRLGRGTALEYPNFNPHGRKEYRTPGFKEAMPKFH